jgi:hypothetical protein
MRSSCAFPGKTLLSDPAITMLKAARRLMVAPSSGGAAAIIVLERWRPYDRGQPFLRDGFWVDLVTCALFQSYFLP